jgi:hypothetical protein
LKGLDMFVVDGSGVGLLWVVCNVVGDDKVTKELKTKLMCKVGLHSFYFNLCGVVWNLVCDERQKEAKVVCDLSILDIVSKLQI